MQGTPALLFGLGLVGVVFGLVSFLLLAMGAPTDLTWIFGNFILGFVLIAAGLGIGFQGVRERLATAEAKRVSKYGSSALFSTLFGIAILGGLAFLAQRHPTRFDWSEGRVHSLSDQTRKVLESLPGEVQVLALYAALDAARVRELLERYAYESTKFKFEFADPNARPDLVQRYAIAPEKLKEGLLRVALGEESVELEDASEPALTNAIVKLTRTGEKKVYFLEGHGERPIEGEGADGKEGFTRAADALKNENYGYASLLLASTGEVPEDADVVVLAGATRPLLPEEQAALKRYMDKNGSLLVLLDPEARTNVVELLGPWGVDVGDDVIVDRVQGLFGRAATPLAEEYADHPIAKELREVTMFHVARSVQAAEPAKDRFTEIVKTSKESWAERDVELFFGKGRAELGGDDLRGPVSVAVAGTLGSGAQQESGAGENAAGTGEGPKGGRLVVVGDSDFASNQLLDAYLNRDLFVNAVNWLLGDVEAISVRANSSRPSQLSQLTAQDFSRIRYLSLFLLPEAIAVLGVIAWWSRRRAPGR